MEANGTGLKGFQDKLLVNFINSLHEIFKMRIAAYWLVWSRKCFERIKAV